MKQIIKLAFLLLPILGIGIQQARATHVMGADISYTCDSAYVFTFKVTFYRDCRGVSFANPSSTTKIRNLSNGKSASVSLTQISIEDVTPVCSKAGKPCNPKNTYGTGQGIEAHTFTTTIDFKKSPYSAIWDASNCRIVIETGQCCRNGAITTGAANQNFYTYAMIDLCKGYVNSSPQYVSQPIALACCNQPLFTTMGGYDYTDGDSLVYKLAHPLSALNTNISYSSGYSYLKPFKVYDPSGSGAVNPNANPPIGLYVDSESGQIIFMPVKCDESTVAVMEVEEWRKDSSGKYQIIGTTRRDMQFWVNVCQDNNPPILKGPYSYKVKATPCTDQTFCFNVSSDDKVYVPPPPLPTPPADTVRISAQNLPNGVTMTILNPTSRTPSAQICVDMSKVDKSVFVGKPLNIELTATDNACPRNAVTRRVYKVTFDVSEAIGKLKGDINDDQNLNCKTDASEKPLTHPRKLSIDGNKLIYLTTDREGKFELCLDTGTRQVSLVPDPWFKDSCTSVTLNIKKDSTHTTRFHSRLKEGIGGYVFSDNNSCKQGAGNKPVARQLVVAQPGNHYALTDVNGFYLFGLTSGTYKIALVNDTSRWKNRCKDTMTVTASSGKTVFADTFFNYQKEVVDLAVTFNLNTGGTVRRGDAPNGSVFVQNKGSFGIDTATIYLETDKNLIDLSKSDGGWKDLGNGKYSYLLTSIQAGAKKWLKLKVKSTSGYSLNDRIPFTAYTDRNAYSRELDTTNNTFSIQVRVVSAYDPNDKQATPDSIFTVTDRKLTYTVRFQNEGNASALNVVLRDTLPKGLDLSTLEMLHASHPFDYILEGRHLWIFFNNIDLPPKSTDPNGSIGSATFSIKLDADSYEETIIRNRAGIYFDIEDVVLTNYKVNHFKSPIEFSNPADLLICGASDIAVPFRTHFKPASNNRFILEITDSSGAHSSFRPLDTLTSAAIADTFRFHTPSWLLSGKNYVMRIRSTSPALICFDDAYKTNCEVEILGKPMIQLNKKDLCTGEQLNVSSTLSMFKNDLYKNGNLVSGSTTPNFNVNGVNNADRFHIVQSGQAGCVVSTDTVEVSVYAKPTLSISADSMYCSDAVHASFTFVLTNSAGIDPVDSVRWNFGDSQTETVHASAKTISHAYAKGYFLAEAIATNGVCSAAGKVPVYFKHEPNARIDLAQNSYCSGESVTLDHSSTVSPGTINAQEWRFGDGSSSTASSVNHVYTSDTTVSYNIVLTVTDNFGCSGVTSTGITINKLPHCGFSWSFPAEARTVDFSADSSDYSSYLWSFGDGQTSTDIAPRHVYASGNTYSVRLQVTDDNQCNCDLSRDVLVNSVSVPGVDGTNLRIYPNPTNGLIFIEGAIDGYFSYRITDQNGRVLKSSELKSARIDASALSNGHYYLELIGSDKVITLPVLLSK
ncbi:MAG: PKD domain-containing protein [Flavobacteriales bacterium]|nr:PKD domain-containing protein [Flavobacteriales bacterium]